jgi:carboxyl-terminal processing protease
MRLARLALGALALVALAARGEAPLDPGQSLADFDAVWKAIDRGYAYHAGSHSAWKRARDVWRPRARTASRAQLAAALDGLLSTLHDENVALAKSLPGMPRAVPEEADLWARWRDGAAVIEAVRIFGDGDVAGLKPGDVIVSVDGVPIERAVTERLRGSTPDARARDWALRRIVAGPRAGQVRLEVASKGRRRTAVVERRSTPAATAQAVLARRVGDARDLGYLRLKGPLEDANGVAEFDAALDALAGTRGLLLDLREVTGRAASHEAVVAMLGRFVRAPAAWQRREGTKRAVDTAPPRRSAYEAPVAVLVDRWTAGEGEALAAGMVAVAKARLVGTPMAGLRGELTEFRAPHSGIAVRFPSHRVQLPDGSPRERLAPSVAVDLSQPQVGAGDPILYQALKLLE